MLCHIACMYRDAIPTKKNQHTKFMPFKFSTLSVHLSASLPAVGQSACLQSCLSSRLHLSTSLHLCMSTCLPFRLSACVPVCLSGCVPVCLRACLPICLSACLPLRLHMCLPVCMFVWMFPSFVSAAGRGGAVLTLSVNDK
jgi:hypothetical protein